MKYSVAKQTYPALLNVNNLWTKKFSEIHLTKADPFCGQTKCGMPMLGNNYSEIAIKEDREICQACLDPHA